MEAIAFALLASPMLVAWYSVADAAASTSRTSCHPPFSAASSSWSHRGPAAPASFAIAWALVVPVEACLSGSRRVIAWATALALVAVAMRRRLRVCRADRAGHRPRRARRLLHALGVVAAVAYGGSVAFMTHRLEALGLEISRSGEARYALLAENMNDLVTRHGASGQVGYASPAALAMLGVAPESLSGQGLFERVHVSDRPAYLSALSRALMTDGGLDQRVPPAPRGGDAAGLHLGRDALPPGRRHGEARHVVAVMRDISARKAHEVELEAARAAAETGQRGQEPLPRHDEPRAAHAAQRGHRLLRDADQRGDDGPRSPSAARNMPS